MHSVLLIFHVLIAVALIGLILVQHGKGADMGAAFGSGASSTVFGARGSGSFLTTATAILAFLFFANSFLLDYMAGNTVEAQSIMQRAADGSAGGGKPAGDDTEVIDTQIEPVQVPAVGEETKTAPNQGDLPPIPGAANAGPTAAAAAQKPAPTAAAAAQVTPVPTSAPEPTAAPEPTPAPTAVPAPTVAPTEVPTVPPKKGAAASKHKPTKKPAKPAHKSRKED